MFRFSAKPVNRAYNFRRLRIERSYALAAAISREDSLRLSVEQNDIRIISNRDPINNSEGLQIEYHDRTWIAATDETSAEIFGDGDAVHALARNLADQSAGI